MTGHFGSHGFIERAPRTVTCGCLIGFDLGCVLLSLPSRCSAAAQRCWAVGDGFYSSNLGSSPLRRGTRVYVQTCFQSLLSRLLASPLLGAIYTLITDNREDFQPTTEELGGLLQRLQLRKSAIQIHCNRGLNDEL